MDSSDGLEQLLRESGISPESRAAHQMLNYLALLEKWNSRINLTASTEWRKLEPLFREGIWASRFYPDESFSHLDIGSGAGFPAVVMRILVPRICLELVESRAKKGAFLETAADKLDLSRTRVHQVRLSDFLRGVNPDKIWDCISWKGLKLSTDDVLQLAAHAHTSTQFWMFHGGEPAVETPEVIESRLKLLRSEKFPRTKESALSIYLRR